MRRFKFTLQAALELRGRAVEAAENALRIVQVELNANQREQQELVDSVREAELAVSAGPVVAEDFVALDKYREAAQRRRWRLAQEAVGIAKRLAERQAALQLAERDRKLLMRLKEKAMSHWQFEFDKEQQQLAEESFLSRWNVR